MGRRAVEVEVVLLDVLPVIPFLIGQAEEPLLEDRLVPVPKLQSEAERLTIIRDAGEAVFAPFVGEGARQIVAEVPPAVAVRAVAIPHRPPLPLAQIGSPF